VADQGIYGIMSHDPLYQKHIVLGVTGSISCYKALDIASKLVQAGAYVDVVLTKNATEFIQPLAFKALTNRQPYVNMFDLDAKDGESHVELARRCDAMLIAPLTATTMAKLSHGIADDLVALTALATDKPLLVAPAMDSQMWINPATQYNMKNLIQRGVQIIGPAEGRLASGRVGAGRLVEPTDIVDELRYRLARELGDLSSLKVVVTAGGTREAIDPVRYVGNRSTGKMGYAIAEAARNRGASVSVVTTVDRQSVVGIRDIRVETAAEMLDAVQQECQTADVLVMAGAVADYRPMNVADQKIKKPKSGASNMTIELEETTDIIASIGSQQKTGRLVKVAFAAETQDLIDNARRKIVAKGADFIVANDVSAVDSGFAVDTNRVTILDASGLEEALPVLSKYEVANVILSKALPLIGSE
jgi:phosphopantothenoylcysteine decarboxylase/phosphopantothenate--cysteine ligase